MSIASEPPTLSTLTKPLKYNLNNHQNKNYEKVHTILQNFERRKQNAYLKCNCINYQIQKLNIISFKIKINFSWDPVTLLSSFFRNYNVRFSIQGNDLLMEKNSRKGYRNYFLLIDLLGEVNLGDNPTSEELKLPNIRSSHTTKNVTRKHRRSSTGLQVQPSYHIIILL